MRARPLLQALDFGADVADFDDQLSRYFVETSAFRDVIADRADLILGEKGSGKSAIFRHLSDENASIPEIDDVDILPAFNTQGSVIFRRLSEHREISEDAFRFVWFTYVVGVVGNHLLHNYAHNLDLRRLRKTLGSAGLHLGEPSVRGLWERIDNILETMSQRVESEGEVKLAWSRIPVNASLRAKLLPGRRRSMGIDPEEVFELCVQAFETLGRRCWLVFDRLDEAFASDRQLEAVALRGLLRAHLDVASFRSTVRTKLFLRSDVLDRITADAGFVNATHLRLQRLQWDREGILDLIARRIVACTEVASFLRLEPSDLKSDSARKSAVGKAFPQLMGPQDFIGWLELYTVDARGALNPRNTITLLQAAREHQLRKYDRDDPPYSYPLLTKGALDRGLADLSFARLDDTVLAEYHELRPALAALKGRPAKLSLAQFARAMQRNHDSPELARTVELLKYVGALGAAGDILTVPPLYRPALRSHLTRSGSGRDLREEEKARLQAQVQEACLRAQVPGEKARLADLDPAEEQWAGQLVKSGYPDMAAAVVKAGTGLFKELVIWSPGRTDDESLEDASLTSLDGIAFINEDRLDRVVDELKSKVLKTRSMSLSRNLTRLERKYLMKVTRPQIPKEDRAPRLIGYVRYQDGTECVIGAWETRIDVDPADGESVQVVQDYVSQLCELARKGSHVRIKVRGKNRSQVLRNVTSDYTRDVLGEKVSGGFNLSPMPRAMP